MKLAYIIIYMYILPHKVYIKKARSKTTKNETKSPESLDSQLSVSLWLRKTFSYVLCRWHCAHTETHSLLILCSVVQSQEVLLALGLNLGIAGQCSTWPYAAATVTDGQWVEMGHATGGLSESSRGPRGKVKEASDWLGHCSQQAFANTSDESLGEEGRGREGGRDGREGGRGEREEGMGGRDGRGE